MRLLDKFRAGMWMSKFVGGIKEPIGLSEGNENRPENQLNKSIPIVLVQYPRLIKIVKISCPTIKITSRRWFCHSLREMNDVVGNDPSILMTAIINN